MAERYNACPRLLKLMPKNPVLQHAAYPARFRTTSFPNWCPQQERGGDGTLQTSKSETGTQCLLVGFLKRGALNMPLQKVNMRCRAYLEDGSYAAHSVVAKWRATSLNLKVKVIRSYGRILF